MSEYRWIGQHLLGAIPSLHTYWCALFFCAVALVTGCKSFLGSRPIADRLLANHAGDWTPEQRVMPYAEIDGSQYLLRNIRDFDYLSAQDFVVNYSDRLIDRSQIQTVDFIVVPFKRDSPLAHTMVSFGLDDGSYLCLSVESRRQVGDSYRALAGLTRGYDLIYVLGEERDLVGVRANQFDVDVFIYPTRVTPEQAQAFFADMIGRLNDLHTNPEFYHLITNNCTTNLRDHVNRISPNRIDNRTWATLFTGFSARYAYQIGLIENRIPFEDLQAICYVNDLAKEAWKRPDFSQHIRSRRYQIELALDRQQRRDRTLAGRGNQFLEQQRKERTWMLHSTRDRTSRQAFRLR